MTPAQLFVGSFAVLIVLGTVGFRVLPGLYIDEPLSWLDAFFTATSAVCVTGLIVVDTATFFTGWGQAYILLLIQVGGLGIITFTSLIITTFGLRLSLRQESITRATADIAPNVDHRRLTRHIVLFTFAMEALGMLLLYALWVEDFGFAGAAWPAVFHAVSAFCNAGFSIFSDSLMAFQDGPFLLTTIMALIVLGGIGFLALEELYMQQRSQKARRSFRLSLHTRIVLVTTGALLVGGWVLLTSFEWQNTLDGMPVLHKLVNGLFMSVTPRTAGFNTIDYQHASNPTNFLTVLLMSIGGSPGSTAGGLKTTTFALIGLVAWSRLRGYTLVHVWNRTVPEDTVQRAVGVFVLVFAIVAAAIFVFASTEIEWIAYTDSAGFLPIMFEATSAFNTVGLSMGMTDGLSSTGRLITILLMFVGRVGPLTFAASLARRKTGARGQFRYAREDVAIG